MTYNGKNVVILNNAEQYILKDTIAKFDFSLKISKFSIYIIKYKADLMCSFYGVFKKTEVYLDVLNTKAQIQKELKLKSGYEVFKSFQATVAPK